MLVKGVLDKADKAEKLCSCTKTRESFSVQKGSVGKKKRRKEGGG